MSFLNRINTAKVAAMPSGADAATALRDYASEAGARIAALPEAQAVRTGAALAIDSLLQDLLPELEALGSAPITAVLNQRAFEVWTAIDRTLELLAPDESVA
jgi:hypothetical protein